MIIKNLSNGINVYYPDKGKKIKHINGNELYNSMIISKVDSIDNYEEVDELWTSDTPDITEEEINDDIVIRPNSEGNFSFNDVKTLVDNINMMKTKMMSLQNSNDELKRQLLEISEKIN